MEDALTGGQLFGLTRTNNHNGNEQSQVAYVFRTKLDSTTGAVMAAGTGSADFKIKLLDSSALGTQSTFLGMKRDMEESSGDYYIHCIYSRSDTQAAYYLRVSPDLTTGAVAQRITDNSNQLQFIGYDAAFVGTQTSLLGAANQITGYQSYFVGSAV